MKTIKNLPQGWEHKELGELFKVEKKQIASSDKNFISLPFIGLENIESHTRKYVNATKFEDAGDSSCFLFDETHVLYGKLRPYLDKIFLPKSKGKCSMELLPLKPKEGFSREFVANVMQSKNVIDYAVKHSTGGRMPRANMNKLLKLKILIPIKPQDRDKLSNALDEKLYGITEIIYSTKTQNEAITALQGAILRDIFPPKDNAKLPAGWHWRQLQEVCFVNPRKKKDFFREENKPTSFVPMDAIDEFEGRITKKLLRPYLEVQKGYTYFEEGDVLFAKITPCMQNGKSCIVKDVEDEIGFGSTEFHVLRAKDGVLNEWIYYFVRRPEFRKNAEEHFEGSAGQQRVSTDFMKEALIPVPPTVKEQKERIGLIKQKISILQNMSRKALVQTDAAEALSGAILREAFSFDTVGVKG